MFGFLGAILTNGFKQIVFKIVRFLLVLVSKLWSVQISKIFLKKLAD